MTRWGVLSDIHGNLSALERAMATFGERGVERIAVLGDNLGRGDSDGCVATIRQVAEVSVLGNRDIDWQQRVSRESADYVLGLPRIAMADGLAFSHGDARLTRDLSTSEIRTGFKRARWWMLATDCRVWFFGHSHHARVWQISEPETAPTLLFSVTTAALPALIRLPDPSAGADDLTIVNVGSVGLPFPGKGPASATVYDPTARTIELFPV
jgi:predicted phosphodiesterase